MAVYLPTSVVGNSRTLVTLGHAGEVMGFFYPHIDYAQNVKECMTAVYCGEPGRGQLVWTFEGEWTKAQSYVPDTNVVVTTLTNAKRGLRLTLTDLIPPNAEVFLRRFTIENVGRAPFTGRLFQYFDLNLGEVSDRNAARRLTHDDAIVQEWRHLCLAVNGDPFDQFQCGKASPDAHSNAKRDMMDGALMGQRLDIGDVSFAVGWNAQLPPQQSLTRHLIIAPGLGERQALQTLREARQRGFQSLYEETETYWRQWLERARPVNVRPPFDAAYRRALLTLPMLYDEHYGSFLGAPEFDPLYEDSGGYGYCWTRDAAEVVVALSQVGYPEYAERFFQWCDKTQHDDGFWHQRYWLGGDVGPTWCTYDDAIQIDQTGAVLWAMQAHAQTLPDERRLSFIKRHWQTVRRAAEYLRASLNGNGLHQTAFDLWETFRGSFTYSNASIYAAMQAAAAFAQAMERPQLADEWSDVAQRVKQACGSVLWNGQRFARGLNERDEVDLTIDSSILGTVDPFDMLSLQDENELRMVESIVRSIEQTLSAPIDSGRGIRRFEWDSYAGGPPATVNTLWFVRVLLRIAKQYAEARDLPRARALRERAMPYLLTSLRRTTPSGLLPELMAGPHGKPYWAAPHGWASASLVFNVLLLDELEREIV
jgi:oligosaccharide amylase